MIRRGLLALCGLLALPAFGQWTNVSVFLPDNDPVLFNGRYILLNRGDYSFRLHVPPAYTDQRPWPCLFAIGEGADEAVAAAGERWLVVDIPGGSDESAVAGFVVAHDWVARQYRLTGGLKFVAAPQAPQSFGFAALRSGFAGAMSRGGRLGIGLPPALAANSNLLVWTWTASLTNDLPAGARARAAHKGEGIPAALEWMEEQVALELPYDPPLKEFYVAEFNRWADEAEPLAGEPRANAVARLERLAEARELSSEPRISKRLDALGRQPEKP